MNPSLELDTDPDKFLLSPGDTKLSRRRKIEKLLETKQLNEELRAYELEAQFDSLELGYSRFTARRIRR